MLCCGDTVHFDEFGGIVSDISSVTNQRFALVRVWSVLINHKRGTRLIGDGFLRAFSGMNGGLWKIHILCLPKCQIV